MQAVSSVAAAAAPNVFIVAVRREPAGVFEADMWTSASSVRIEKPRRVTWLKATNGEVPALEWRGRALERRG
jgi:hypothetical protein